MRLLCTHSRALRVCIPGLTLTPESNPLRPLMRFRVDLELYSGPLDLLFYLVRKHELDILDIPIAEVIEQYMALLKVLEAMDVNAVGDFLELASRLMEIKSRLLLPKHEEQAEEQVEDPRHDLVQRLLEYKKYKDAASRLDDQGRTWRQHYSRQACDLPEYSIRPEEQPIQEVELWDLVSAFGCVLQKSKAAQTENIRSEEIPLEVYMERIRNRLARTPRIAFEGLFDGDSTRLQQVSMFLALLELIRHERVQVQQQDLFGEIWVMAAIDTAQAPNLSIARVNETVSVNRTDMNPP
jgi:segregation and condensation protein A